MHRKVVQAVELKSNDIKKVLITGGVDGGRGCTGDVKNMLLETGKIKSTRQNNRHKRRLLELQSVQERGSLKTQFKRRETFGAELLVAAKKRTTNQGNKV